MSVRLVKFTKAFGKGVIMIAPGSVVAVEPRDGGGKNEEACTWVWCGDRTQPFAVKEDLGFVVNALYYKNDGGHEFANTFKSKEEG